VIEFAANFPDVVKRGTAILIEKSLIRPTVAYSFLLLHLVHPTTIDPGVEGGHVIVVDFNGHRQAADIHRNRLVQRTDNICAFGTAGFCACLIIFSTPPIGQRRLLALQFLTVETLLLKPCSLTHHFVRSLIGFRARLLERDD
jgi:hypothetical protein